jgi:hypothetical protein
MCSCELHAACDVGNVEDAVEVQDTALGSGRERRNRIASLVPGQQQSGMWDVLEITRSGLPRVILLRHLP